MSAETHHRPDWESYFLGFAQLASTRATCPRAAVGAIVVVQNRIIATGYNGAASGDPHCLDVGCEIVENHCIRAQHAEANALSQCAAFGQPSAGATVYIFDNVRTSTRETGMCYPCRNFVRGSGVEVVVLTNIDDKRQRVHMKKVSGARAGYTQGF